MGLAAHLSDQYQLIRASVRKYSPLAYYLRSADSESNL